MKQQFYIIVFSLLFLSPAITQNYPDGIVSYWKFEDGSGPIAQDIINENDGTLINNPQWTTGIVGGALDFNRTNYIDCGADGSLDMVEELTVMAWIKRVDPYSDIQTLLVSKGRDDDWRQKYGCDSYQLSIFGNRPDDPRSNLARFRYDNNKPSSYCCALRSTSEITDATKWYYLVGTFDHGTAKIYVDGILENSRNDPYNLLPTSNPLRIGYDYYFLRPAFNGIIDEVAIFNRALTEVEIQLLYQNGLKGLGYELISVLIDIKPSSDTNSINPDANGVIPVAILTTSDFDAANVDPFTLQLEGGAIKLRGKSGNAGALEDIDGDGDLDLVVQILNETDLQPGDTEATLTGETFDGIPIWGTDHINIVPPDLSKKNVEYGESSLPEEYVLEQNHPNPFNPETEIRFRLLEDAFVVLKIYNTLGQEICVLAERNYEAGFHNILWDGKDMNGNNVTSGIYIYTIQAGEFRDVKKMVLLQ